jgi:mannose-1-phosphate guanylyltransferase
MHDSSLRLVHPPRFRLSSGSGSENRWAVILAGGDGSRLLSLTREIAGDDRPKQFCAIINGNTLLDVTRRRVALTLPPEKTMFVLTRKHAPYFNDTLAGTPDENLLVQPKNAGTTPAILYSLLRLEHIDPEAAVAYFPSDHYFSDDHAFMSQVEFAFTAANQNPDQVFLLGIEPEGPDEEYGWIETKSRTLIYDDGPGFWPVRRFWEKPSPALARSLMARGCLWNSFVMVGAVSAFLNLIRRASGELYMKFATVKSTLFSSHEAEAMEGIYSKLRDSNFSREVLQARPQDLAVVPVRGSKWSDLGSPRRVFAAMSDLGGASLIKKEPAAQSMKVPRGYYERTKVQRSEAV